MSIHRRSFKDAVFPMSGLTQQVAPIMKKRSWLVPKLKEFLPDNRGLLGMNVNRGETILIRRTCTHCTAVPCLNHLPTDSRMCCNQCVIAQLQMGFWSTTAWWAPCSTSSCTWCVSSAKNSLSSPFTIASIHASLVDSAVGIQGRCACFPCVAVPCCLLCCCAIVCRRCQRITLSFTR